MPRTSTTYSAGDTPTAVRMNQINSDLDTLFSKGNDRLLVRFAASAIALHIDVSAGIATIGNTSYSYAGGTDIAVTNNATNYVEINTSGALVINTTGWTSTPSNLCHLAVVVASGGVITSIVSWKSDAVGIPDSTSSDSVIFGTDLDGDYTLPNDITISRDMFYGTLNLNGHILNIAGYRVFARAITGTTGKIKAGSGGNGGAGNNASGSTKGTGGSAGAGVTGVTLQTSLPGLIGGDGNNGSSNSATPGANGTNGNAVINSLGTTAGTNGGGGASGQTSGQNTSGGSGGTGSTPAIHALNDLVNYIAFCTRVLTTFSILNGVGQSGSGGGGGGSNTGGGGAGGGGGGGGGSGGIGGFWFVSCKTASGGWTIESIGGNGGNGGNGATASTVTGGSGGGGAGGGGGSGIFIYHDRTGWTGSQFVLTGGAHGAGGGGGRTGSDGSDGPSGIAFQIQA